MADAFLVRRGGSGGGGAVVDGEYAVIGVEYPAGSTCTCAKGGINLQAKGSGGAVAYNIPEAGTWTAQITNGAKTKSKSVEITYEGQVEKVKLGYSLDLITPESGLLSGYSLGGGNTSMTGNKLEITNAGGCHVTPKIDLTDYTTLTVIGVQTWASATGMVIAVGVQNRSTPQDSPDTSAYAAYGTLPGTSGTVTIDVASLTGEHWLVVQGGESGGYGSRGEITSIILS